MNNLHLADALLVQFCRRAERTYGKSTVTPNMHGHLNECILDSGPIHNFWCFSLRDIGKLSNSSLEVHCFVLNF